MIILTKDSYKFLGAIIMIDLPDESQSIEYKSDFPQNQHIIKTIVAFTNGFGGRLIIGVDNRKKIIGVAQSILQEKMEYLHKMIYESVTPNIMPQIYSQQIENKYLLIIEVVRGIQKPYFITSKGIKDGTYIRAGRSTLHADENTIRELEWLGRGVFLDETPQYFTSLKDLDVSKVESFLKSRKFSKDKFSNEQLLQSYGLIYKDNTQSYLTIAGNLLFGKSPNRYLPESFILCSNFKGTSGRNAIASIVCNGNLFEQLDKSYQFIIDNLSKSYTIKGTRRIEKLEIPELAIREALINAIVHRNYFIAGPIKIAIYTDRLEIFSPGGFPGPIDVSNLGNGVTYIRNHAISKVLFELGIIEKLGSGFVTIFAEYKKSQLENPIIIDGGNYIKCILPRTVAKIAKDQEVDYENASTRKIKELFLKKDNWSISQIVSETSIPRSSAALILKHLVLGKQIVLRGRGPAARYFRK